MRAAEQLGQLVVQDRRLLRPPQQVGGAVRPGREQGRQLHEPDVELHDRLASGWLDARDQNSGHLRVGCRLGYPQVVDDVAERLRRLRHDQVGVLDPEDDGPADVGRRDVVGDGAAHGRDDRVLHDGLVEFVQLGDLQRRADRIGGSEDQSAQAAPPDPVEDQFLGTRLGTAVGLDRGEGLGLAYLSARCAAVHRRPRELHEQQPPLGALEGQILDRPHVRPVEPLITQAEPDQPDEIAQRHDVTRPFGRRVEGLGRLLGIGEVSPDEPHPRVEIRVVPGPEPGVGWAGRCDVDVDDRVTSHQARVVLGQGRPDDLLADEAGATGNDDAGHGAPPTVSRRRKRSAGTGR